MFSVQRALIADCCLLYVNQCLKQSSAQATHLLNYDSTNKPITGHPFIIVSLATADSRTGVTT
jgi:hypothetical protein